MAKEKKLALTFGYVKGAGYSHHVLPTADKDALIKLIEHYIEKKQVSTIIINIHESESS